MLTRRQSELLCYLVAYAGEADGMCPTYSDMAKALGLKSKSGIHKLITGLEWRGFIQRLPHQARAIRVIRRPGEEPAPTVENLRSMVGRICAEQGPEIVAAALLDMARDIVVVVPRAEA